MTRLISTTVTDYGTKIQKFLNLNANWPVATRKYIPAQGSKLKNAGIESITRFTSPVPCDNNKYTVVLNGIRKFCNIDELRKLVKELNVKNMPGHTPKNYLNSVQKSICEMQKLS